MMENKISKRNCSIDIFRYVCALLIVVIHAHPFLAISKAADEIAIDYVTRIAVPYFFVVSGYFYSKRMYGGKKPFISYVLKLVGVYSIWSVLYAIRFWLNNRDKLSVKEIVIVLIKGYCYRGTSEHLWFVPALIFSIAVLTLFIRIKKERLMYIASVALFVIACFGFTYRHLVGDRLPLLSALYRSDSFTYFHRLFIFGISFVLLGNLICRCEALQKAFSSKQLAGIVLITYLLFVAEKAAATALGFSEGNLYNLMLYPLVLFIFLLLLKNPQSKHGQLAKYASNASSFIYYSHTLLIALFGSVFINADSSYRRILIYVCTCAAATAVSALITKIDNKYLNFFGA